MTSLARTQTRRKIALEMLSLAVPMSSAVFFSGLLVAGWSRADTLLVTTLTAATCVAYLVWHRGRHPASIAPWGASADQQRDDDEDDDGGWWDPFTIMLFAISLTAVVVVGVVARFMLPLGVIVLFGVADSGSDLGDVIRAALAMLAVSAVVELGVVIPMCRVWNLSIDEDPPPRSDFCPTPTDQA